MNLYLSANLIKLNCIKSFLKFLMLVLVILTSNVRAYAQDKNQMVRLAKLKIDYRQLESYKAALREQMTEAVKVEPGVLTYYAVAEKKDESSITILEIYKDTAAYNSHILTPHFKKYKEKVKDMVKSLELLDVSLIGVAQKRIVNH